MTSTDPTAVGGAEPPHPTSTGVRTFADASV